MLIGVVARSTQSVTALEDLIGTVVSLDRQGFDLVTTPTSHNTGFDALAVLSMAAARTSRIRLCAGVVPSHFMHPVTMARQAMTVQAASNGRFVLGIGVSDQEVIEDALGLSFARPAEHTAEYLSVLQPLIKSGRVKFKGRQYNVDTELSVPGSSPCPVMVAALLPKMLRVAGELADGTFTWLAGPRSVGDYIVPRITAAARSAGRPGPEVWVAMPMAVTDDRHRALEDAAEQFERHRAVPSYRRLFEIEGVSGPADVCLLGTEAELERRIRELADAGATAFVASLFPTGDEPKESLDRTMALLRGLIGSV